MLWLRVGGPLSFMLVRGYASPPPPIDSGTRCHTIGTSCSASRPRRWRRGSVITTFRFTATGSRVSWPGSETVLASNATVSLYTFSFFRKKASLQQHAARDATRTRVYADPLCQRWYIHNTQCSECVRTETRLKTMSLYYLLVLAFFGSIEAAWERAAAQRALPTYPS